MKPKAGETWKLIHLREWSKKQLKKDRKIKAFNILFSMAIGNIHLQKQLNWMLWPNPGYPFAGRNPRGKKQCLFHWIAVRRHQNIPDEEYTISIPTEPTPAKLDELKQAVFDEINDFVENGPSEEELAKAKEKMLREREISLRENRFWLNILSNTYFLKDGDFSEFGTYERHGEKPYGRVSTKSIRKIF
jgi:hypothetical protein